MPEVKPDETPIMVASTFNTIMAGTEMVLQVNVATPKFDGVTFTGEVVFEPQVRIHMSPQSAKELLILIQQAVSGFEASFGVLRSPFIDEHTKA